MNIPKTFFADAALAARIEPVEALSWFDCAQRHQYDFPKSPLAVASVGGGYAVFPRAGSVHMHALGLGLSDGFTAADLDALEGFYRDHAVVARIEFCPFAQPAFLQILAARGYRLTEYANVLYAALLRQQSEPPPTEAEVRKIRPDECELWARTVAQGFRDEEEVTTTDEETLITFSRLEATSCFIAFMAGEPAGGAAFYRHEAKATAMLFRASTLSQFRERGIHNRLLHERLSDAAALGCDLAFLVSLAGTGSQRNAQRRGFQIAYTRTTLVRELTPNGV
jgi:hypothetical protein